MKYQPIDSSFFVENRKRFTAHLPKGAMAIFHSNDEMPRNGDGAHPFRQQSDIFYLSGIDQEQTVLILFPDCSIKKYREIIFTRQTSDLIKIWEGYKLTKEQAQNRSGIETAMWTDGVDSTVNMLMLQAQAVYLNLNENDRAHSDVESRDMRYAKRLRNQFPLHTYGRSAPIMSDIRSIKHEPEIQVIQKACNITEDAFRRVLGFTKPGVMEYEIEAEITHEFLRQAGTCHAYSPIIAAGGDSCILHYTDNNKECKDGDILLMDFGCEYGNYAADLTRTIPVNGKFSSRQRAVYDATLRVMKNAKELLRPGKTLDAYNSEVGLVMEKELVDLRLISMEDIKNQKKERPAYKKYFMHGTSHFLGLDVHDIGDRYSEIKEGMCFTIEPGIYIPEENLGIRIENDVVVERDSVRDLLATCPIEAEEIENLMNS